MALSGAAQHIAANRLHALRPANPLDLPVHQPQHPGLHLQHAHIKAEINNNKANSNPANRPSIIAPPKPNNPPA